MTARPPARAPTARSPAVRVGAFALVACGALAPLRALAGDEPVAAELEWEPGSPVPAAPQTVEITAGGLEPGALPDDGVELRSGHLPLRAAPRGIAVALDLAPGSERVWFDTDGDGSLADERPVAWQRAGLAWSATGVVQVPGAARGVRVGVRLRHGGFRGDDEFLCEVGAHRWGAVALRGALRMVALDDGDGDLTFRPGGADRVLVDLDGDGVVGGGRRREWFTLGERVVVDGTPYAVECSADGARVELRPDTPEPLPEPGVAPPVPSEDFEALYVRFQAERRAAASARAATIRRIGALGNDDARVLLLHAARTDVDADVRVLAVEALGSPAFAAGADELTQLAREAPSAIAAACVRALHGMGWSGREALYAELLLGAPPAVAEEAARHLDSAHSSAARSALVRALRERGDPPGRVAVFRGAERSPCGVPSALLVAACEDGFAPLAARAVATALEQGEPRARRALHDAVQKLRPGVAAGAWLPACSSCGDDTCVDALVTIGANGADGADGAAALSLLLCPEDSIVAQRLSVALGSPEWTVRAFAARVLGVRGDPRAAGRLLEQLEVEQSLPVRGALLDALGEIGDVRAVAAYARLAGAEGGGSERAYLAALGTPWMRGVPEVQAALRTALAATGWRTREQAVRAMAATADAALFADLGAALRDENRAVRAAAATALGDLRVRDGVRLLIDLLAAGERNVAVRDAAAGSLFRLTGANLYDDAALWEQWWADHGATFRVPERTPVLPPAKAGGTFAKEPARFYGIPIETESVVFVIDQSGSMGAGGVLTRPVLGEGGTKWDTAVRELLGAVEALDDGVELNVILFASAVRAWHQNPERLSKPARRSLKRFLDRVEPNGSTNLFDALERALRSPRVETIVVLSDGNPTDGRLIDPDAIADAVHEMNERRGIVIHCVSIGGPSPLLRRLATENEGEYQTR